MRLLAWILVVVAVAVTSVSAQSPTGDALRIYLIDVEGGNATLFVSPSGEALLIDTGNGGASADRDVGRIMAAVADAGLQQIDHLITTHWHGDHFGGMTELAKRIPIGHFIDHGLNVQANPTTDAFLGGAYRDLYREARHSVVQPGDRVPLAGVEVTVLASGGEVIQHPLPVARILTVRISNRRLRTSVKTRSRWASTSGSDSSGGFISAT